MLGCMLAVNIASSSILYSGYTWIVTTEACTKPAAAEMVWQSRCGQASRDGQSEA